MEGNERLTLLSPLKNNRDSFGQQQEEYKSIYVYARRQDRGGREGVYSDTRAGQWQTRFEIRATPSLMNINEDWKLKDTFGYDYNLESVSFAPYWGGRRFIWLYAIRITIRGS